VPRRQLTSSEIEAFRRRAVAAATRLFADRGFEAVSMRQLAAELGCSAMTPYRYFASKEELFARVRTEAFRRFADRQARAAADGADARDRLRRLGQAYIDFALDEPEAYRIMFALEQAPSDAYPELEAEQRRAISYLHAAARELVAAGLMDGDPLSLAHVLWGQVHGLVTLHLAGKLIMGRSLAELRAVPPFMARPR
jgi:AcrR family transcriptional regulator